MAEHRPAILFGPFRLVADERLLTRDGMPVDLGSRALDALICLVSRPNEVFSKKDLIARVWPDAIVEEGSLRFQIAGLRKALGDGVDGARYIATLAGRGYCFVAPVSRSADNLSGVAYTPWSEGTNLPTRLSRIIGRDVDIDSIASGLTASRFVTIVGAGGVGKTTVAIGVSHHLQAAIGSVLFIDFGLQRDPAMVPTILSSMLGISVTYDDPAPSVMTFLRDKRMLLIFDNCEHLVEAVAALATQILQVAPHVHVLGTSREPFRVEGEQVYRLSPLSVPPDIPDISASVALSYPAVQLFVERAMASGAQLDFGDIEAPIIAGICGRLDGLALAIELAAGRVAAFGLEQTAVLLGERLALTWQGHRMAPPRQRTLQATLDWSYGLLDEAERRVLLRLAVFVGDFTLEAALAVVPGEAIDQAAILTAIDSLVAKSMVATRPIGGMMRYRLLDTTRAYAVEIDNDDLAKSAARHATYYCRLLEQSGAQWQILSNPSVQPPRLADLNNVRVALEWCFGCKGDFGVGVRLAAAAAPAFLARSLLSECHRWSQKAIEVLDDTTRGDRIEMQLQAASGVSLMFMRGGQDSARVALDRSLALAEQQGDGNDQLQVLAPLQMFYLRTGAFNTALHYAERCSFVAAGLEGSAAKPLAHSLMGISLHLAGELSRARLELEAALQFGVRAHQTTTNYLGFDGRILAGVILARTLWLQGYPQQAAERARETVEDAVAMGHPLTLAIALIWGASAFFWMGDLAKADEYTDRLLAHAEPNSFGPYLAIGHGFRGQVAICRGHSVTGVESLQTSLGELHAAPYELHATQLAMSLVQGLAAINRLPEAEVLLDRTIRSVEANGDFCYLPELLRIRAGLLLRTSGPHAAEAESCLCQSMELSRRQGARSWELRTATDLAAAWAAEGRSEAARTLLQPLLQHFTGGLETVDLKAANSLLANLE